MSESYQDDKYLVIGTIVDDQTIVGVIHAEGKVEWSDDCSRCGAKLDHFRKCVMRCENFTPTDFTPIEKLKDPDEDCGCS